MTAPTTVFRFALDDTDVYGAPLKLYPTTVFQQKGLQPNAPMPRQWTNAAIYNFGAWIDHYNDDVRKVGYCDIYKTGTQPTAEDLGWGSLIEHPDTPSVGFTMIERTA